MTATDHYQRRSEASLVDNRWPREADVQTILDPHVTGECVIILDEDAATVLYEAFGIWLSR